MATHILCQVIEGIFVFFLFPHELQNCVHMMAITCKKKKDKLVTTKLKLHIEHSGLMAISKIVDIFISFLTEIFTSLKIVLLLMFYWSQVVHYKHKVHSSKYYPILIFIIYHVQLGPNHNFP